MSAIQQLLLSLKKAAAAAAALIAVAHDNSPFISTYPWSAGFGTKYANPATLPTGTGNGVAFFGT